MKRWIRVLVGMIAILVSVWAIKKSRKSSETGPGSSVTSSESKNNETGTQGSGAPINGGAPPGLPSNDTDTATGDHSNAANNPGAVSNPNVQPGAGQPGSNQPGTNVTGAIPNGATPGGNAPGGGENQNPAVAVAKQTDEAGNPVVGGGKPVDGAVPKVDGFKGAVPGTPQIAHGVAIPGPAGSSKGSATNLAPPGGPAKGAPANGGTALTQNAANVAAPTPTAKPQPTPTPDVRLKASPAESSCEDQWKQHGTNFKVGGDLAYMTSISVQRPLAPDIATTHIETISQSSASSVKRDISFSSDHPTGILVLTSINPAPELTTTKDSFLALCAATGGRAVHSVLYKLSRAKVLDIADVSVKVGAGTFPAYQMKIEAALLINGKVTNAIADIWMAKNKPGLTVKEVIKIPAKTFTDHGSITISSQLAGTRKI